MKRKMNQQENNKRNTNENPRNALNEFFNSIIHITVNVIDNLELHNNSNDQNVERSNPTYTFRLQANTNSPFPFPLGFLTFIIDEHFSKKVVSSENLKKIKLVNYESSMNVKDCSICLSSFVEDEQVRALDCKHIFHSECVDKWFLKQSSRCPICREEVIKPSTQTV